MDFKNHAKTGLFTGYVYGCALYSLDKVDAKTSIYCILATYLGSILPDYDSDHSRSFNIIMEFLSLLVSFIFILWVNDPRLVPVSFLIYISMRYQVSVVIQRITIHRGVMHSIIALLCCSLSTVLILRYFDIVREWYIGVGLGIGFLSHLLLDEINSLYDLKSKKFVKKKSFGTAMKLCSNSWSSVVVCGIILVEIIILIMGEL